MRTIKFRAWDGNKMCFVDALYQPFGTALKRADIIGPYEEKTRSVLIEDVELMQFTGLTDNIVEMYEGDILSINDKYTETIYVGVGEVPVAQWNENHIAAIEFRDGEFGVYINEEGEVVMKGWRSLKMLREEDGVDFEVIGNIYENPELLSV